MYLFSVPTNVFECYYIFNIGTINNYPGSGLKNVTLDQNMENSIWYIDNKKDWL